MNGQVLGVGAAALLVAAGLFRKKQAGSPQRVNEDLAAALRAYRPPFLVGSAARRKTTTQVSPQDTPGQERLPGFTDPDLIARGLMAPKGKQGAGASLRRRRVKPLDVEAQVQRKGREALDEEMEDLAVADLEAMAPQGEPQRRDEGPWELFLRSVPGDVSDDILVALLLADGTGDPVLRARELLSRLRGALGQVVAGTFVEEVGGTPAAKARLIAAAELSRRATVRQMFGEGPKVVLDNPGLTAQFIRQMSQGPKEIVSAIYLNGRHEVLAYRVLHVGAPSVVLMDIPEILRPAVELRARNIIVGHNHPSGDPSPSSMDIAATMRLKQAASLLGMELVDHVIVGADGHYSFRQHAQL